MKNQNTINKLAFNKVAVAELNDTKMDVDGGTTPVCLPITIIVLTLLPSDL
ncbi:class I lanthipeptide [Flavobacterium hydatis]|uniref:class I lanthipeptide n=1 Tax=Flavobacterium hydatis TaxID=991 RepID=UPI000A9FDC84|nr:class I lanthipeptide [Flavobacterium hydatis]